jgi:hypothetical protein
VHWAFCKPLHCVSPHSQFVLNESRIEMSSWNLLHVTTVRRLITPVSW